MSSIRSYLALRLLIGFILLLSIASSLVYFISKRILEADFDARLFAKAQAVIVSISQRGQKIDIDWDNLPQGFASKGKWDNLIQVLDSSGHNLAGDIGDIGDISLSQSVSSIPNQEEYRDVNSPQGEKIRILSLTFQPHIEEDDENRTPYSMRQKCTLIVGGDREHLDNSLTKIAGVLAAMTLLTSVFSLGIVVLALRRGLRPLTSLSREVAQIDEMSLGKRIEMESLPIDLVPIVEKLNDLLGRLEVSFARERRFSADVSHELRTPIAELRSLSEIMLRQPILPADTRQAFQDALDAARQMEALVAMLLEIVRGERDISILEMEKIDLCMVLRTSWKLYESAAQEKDLKANFNIPKQFWLKSDLRLLPLIFNNLFSNAVEYTPVGGTIEASIQQSLNPFVVTIKNESQGVDPEDLPHFFERFWRKDKVRSNSEHMGLGLSLTQMLCRRLQIHLTISMPRPNIVCFWLTLPTSVD